MSDWLEDTVGCSPAQTAGLWQPPLIDTPVTSLNTLHTSSLWKHESITQTTESITSRSDDKAAGNITKPNKYDKAAAERINIFYVIPIRRHHLTFTFTTVWINSVINMGPLKIIFQRSDIHTLDYIITAIDVFALVKYWQKNCVQTV